MSDRFDVVVIGSGPAGYVAAIHAAQSGLSTLVVEKDAAFGGTCLHRGCIPTKALLETARLLEKMQKARRFGISVEGVALDFPGARKYKDRIVKSNAAGVAHLFKKYGVQSARGWGQLLGSGKVSIQPSDDDEPRIVEATRGIILATGSVCKHLPFIEMDHERVIDSDDLLAIETVPESLLVIGAGAVGTEFASIFQRFGSKTILVEVMPQVVPLEDEEVGKELGKALTRRGIRIFTDSRVQTVKRAPEGVEVEVQLSDKSTETLVVSHVLVATGRAPVTSGIGLENTAIETGKGGFIAVDEYMRTVEPKVYAIGDIVPTPMLAHVGSHEGILAIDHLLGKDPHPINYDRVPSCTYCEPEVASVGLTERQARNRGYDVKSASFPFAANGKAKIVNETAGFVKLVSEAKYGELLGVHIVGPKATELIAEHVLALNLEATGADLAYSMHPHPTLSEAVGEAAHALLNGQPIHF